MPAQANRRYVAGFLACLPKQPGDGIAGFLVCLHKQLGSGVAGFLVCLLKLYESAPLDPELPTT